MTPSDAEAFCAHIMALGEMFDRKLSQAVQIMYFDALNDLELPDLVRAMAVAAQQCKWMPKPVELREFALGNLDDEANDYWNGWRKAARIAGATHSLLCENSCASAIEQTFGSWPKACTVELSPEMWVSKRKEFVGNYRRASDKDLPSIVRYLRGTEPPDDKWNQIIYVNRGEVHGESIESARHKLENGPDADVLRRLLTT